MQTIWDWAILDGCFGNTKVSPTDIDGVVERNGYILVLETKLRNVPLPVAQERAFKALVQHNNATVIVVWGEQGRPEQLRVYSRMFPEGRDEAGGLDRLRQLVSRWFEKADRREF